MFLSKTPTLPATYRRRAVKIVSVCCLSAPVMNAAKQIWLNYFWTTLWHRFLSSSSPPLKHYRKIIKSKALFNATTGNQGMYLKSTGGIILSSLMAVHLETLQQLVNEMLIQCEWLTCTVQPSCSALHSVWHSGYTSSSWTYWDHYHR